MPDAALGGSFRDPSGFVFRDEGRIYRQVNRRGAADYDHLMASGLQAHLVGQGLLVPHEEVAAPIEDPARHHRTLRPEPIAFLSYPYEWSFSELQDAALATLRAAREALAFGMTLKDASAFNVQFHEGRPLLIDTLSFERYEEGRPWVAYRQFCQHFLAPLAVMARRDVRLGQLLRVHLDGIPLDLAAALLPRRTLASPGLLLHVHLHAAYQRRHRGEAAARRARATRISRSGLEGVLGSLASAVGKLRWRPAPSEWTAYYGGDAYSGRALERKRELVARYLGLLAPRCVWDLGANMGLFSRLASDRGARVVAFDVDPACVELHYRDVRGRGDKNVLPLLIDLTNPSPPTGWAHRERLSLAERRGPDVLLALALVHHLAIGNNVPLERIARFFAELGDRLIVEFVPKSDPKVRTLLAVREDVFPDYTREGFEAAFRGSWQLEEVAPVEASERVLYWMRRRAGGSGSPGGGGLGDASASGAEPTP